MNQNNFKVAATWTEADRFANGFNWENAIFTNHELTLCQDDDFAESLKKRDEFRDLKYKASKDGNYTEAQNILGNYLEKSYRIEIYQYHENKWFCLRDIPMEFINDSWVVQPPSKSKDVTKNFADCFIKAFWGTTRFDPPVPIGK